MSCSGESRRGFASLRHVAVAAFLCAATIAGAQIGGRTALDGPFLLDNAEDLNLTALGVQRDWVPEYVPEQANAFAAESLSTAGLTLAAGQSPAGALRYTMKTYLTYIDYSFGVPMPAVAGASTATSPGNITSFAELSFLTRYSQALANQQFLVVLETYPQVGTNANGPVYPKIYWSYSLPAGTTFQQVTLDLRSPSQVQNGGGYTLEQLLEKTRFLAFTYFAGPEMAPKTVTVHVDDIRLIPGAAATDWSMFD